MSARLAKGNPIPYRPARCERPAFAVGDAFTFPGGLRFVVRESCRLWTVLDREDAPGNAQAIECATPRLWESVWGRTVRWHGLEQARAA